VDEIDAEAAKMDELMRAQPPTSMPSQGLGGVARRPYWHMSSTIGSSKSIGTNILTVSTLSPTSNP